MLGVAAQWWRPMGPVVLLVLLAAAGAGRGEATDISRGKQASASEPPVVLLEIRPSTVEGAGVGVFLADDSPPVQAGTMLTRYGGREVRAVQVNGGPEELYSMEVPGKPGFVRAGSPWAGPVPSLVSEPVGHLLNDAAAILANLTLTPAAANGATRSSQGGEQQQLSPNGLQRLVDRYLDYSTSRSNIAFTDDAFQGSWAMAATKEVLPGQELFLSYGFGFWLHPVMHQHPSPVTRLLVFLYLGHHRPADFPNGYLTIREGDGAPLLTSTGREPDEEWCQDFVRNFLGLRGGAVMRRLGMSKGMSYRERLDRLIELALVGEMEEDEEWQMAGGAAEAL